MQRASKRANNALRKVHFERNFNIHAEGSVLVYYGDTMVLCTVSVEKGVPFFLRNTKQGWLTAEYSMLPRATSQRNAREAARGKQGGRTHEIQRLIGRSLRACVDLYKLPDLTLTLDCDVIQADGGTRTAAITGGCLALYDALAVIGKVTALKHRIAVVSVGIVNDQVLVDLDYAEDSNAMTDMNLVMDDAGKFVEVQGTAEQKNFAREQLIEMVDAGAGAIEQLLKLQAQALKDQAAV